MITLLEKIDLLILLLSKPEDFLIDRIKDNSLEEMLTGAFPQISFENLKNEEQKEEIIKKIEKDHLYLFVGASKPLASPYESSYFRKESRLMDKPAKDHLKIMNKWGLTKDAEYKDLPDHILSKLNIISILLNHKEKVKEKELKLEIQKDIKELLKNETWTEEFVEKIKENEEVEFYSKIGEALNLTFEELRRIEN